MYIYISKINIHDIHVSDTFSFRSDCLILSLDEHVVSKWVRHEWQVLWESVIKTEDQIMRLKQLIDLFASLGGMIAENEERARHDYAVAYTEDAFAEVAQTASVI